MMSLVRAQLGEPKRKTCHVSWQVFRLFNTIFPGCRIVQDGKENTSCAGVSAPPDVTSQADNNTNAQNNSDNNTVIVLLVVIIAILAVALIVGIIVAVVLVKKNKNKNQ